MNNFTRHLISTCALLAAFGANAAVQDFENTTTTAPEATNFGAGFSSSNFYTIADSYHPGSGYDLGTVSGTHTAFNGFGSPASVWTTDGSDFTFNGAYFTSAWYNDNYITVNGWLDGIQSYSLTFNTNTTTPLWTTFDWNVDRLDFSSSNMQFVMDNFTYNQTVSPVPEPETYAMLLAGLVAVAATAKRRKQS